MKRFFVRCVGQFLCVFGLTSIVSDARAADCDNYSCSQSSSATSSWYIGWPAPGKTAKWSYITGLCNNTSNSDCWLYSSVYWDTGMSGSSSSIYFSTLSIRDLPSAYSSKFKSFLEMCALPTNGYDYPVSGGYTFRPGCAMHGNNLYAVKDTPFSTLGCKFVNGRDEIIASLNTGSGATGSGATGSGSSSSTPDCYYTYASSGTVFTSGTNKLEMVAIVPDVYSCSFSSCKAGCYHRYTNPATSLRYRDEPGAYGHGSRDAGYRRNSIYAEGILNGYKECSTAGCYQASHYTTAATFYSFDNCSSCSTRYSNSSYIGNLVSTPAGSSAATLNWGTSAAGTGEGTCRLSSYQWSVNNGTYRVPCNNSAP